MGNIRLHFENRRYGITMLRALMEALPAMGLELCHDADEADLSFSGFPQLSEAISAIDALAPDAGSSKLSPIEKEGCMVTVFCACLGGCGLSTAASLFAMELSRLLERRVLFLSFGAFAPEGQSALCYRLLQGRAGAASVLERHLVRDHCGVYRARGEPAFNILRLLSEEECAKLFAEISESGAFTDIVVDLPAGAPCFRTLLSLAEYAVLLDDHRRPDSPEQRLFAEEFRRLRGGLPSRELCPGYDGNASDMDMHGQLGTQLKKTLLSGPEALYA